MPSAKERGRGQCVAKLPLTLDMTGWHSSHDRCLKPVPIRVILPPARRTQLRVRGALRPTWQRRFHHIHFLLLSKQMYVKNYTAPPPSLSLLSLFPFGISTPFFWASHPGGRYNLFRPSSFSRPAPTRTDRKRLTDTKADTNAHLDPSFLRFTESPRCCRVFCLHHCLRLSHGILDT